MYSRNREKYEARLDALCEFLEDVVPLRVRVLYKRRKLRLFDAVMSGQIKIPPPKRKLTATIEKWELPIM